MFRTLPTILKSACHTRYICVPHCILQVMADDWDKVSYLRKHTSGPRVVKTAAELNQAQRSGASITAEKRGQGKGGLDAGKAAKIDRETEVNFLFTS